jgi:hypothetical protein
LMMNAQNAVLRAVIEYLLTFYLLNKLLVCCAEHSNTTREGYEQLLHMHSLLCYIPQHTHRTCA